MKAILDTIAKIEAGTKEDLFVYYAEISKAKFTGKGEQRLNELDTRAVLELLKNRKEKKENLYFLIQTSGGHIAAAMQIITELRKHYAQIHFVVATFASSAGAYLSLCGDTLYMRPFSFLSDFGPQNWPEGKFTTPEEVKAQTDIVSTLYQTMLEQLMRGTLKNNLQDIGPVLAELGGPCINGRKPDGKMHGHPITIDNIKKLIPGNVKPHTDIPSPGNEANYIADSFTKLNELLRRQMRSEDLAKLVIFGGHSATQKFQRTT